jgi:MFS family permease
MGMSATDRATAPPKLIAIGIPLLGFMAATQGAAPNINSTALVSLSKDLGMSGGTIALAASVQTIAVAATVISTGLLADRLGRRRVLLAALLVGAAGSIISGIAPTGGVYLIGQAITGVGMGAVYGASFAYIRAVAKPGKLAAALGLFGATIGLSSLVLTFGGGLLIGANWRLGFFVPAVAALVAFALVPLALPAQPRITGKSLDLVGQVLLALGIIGFLVGVSQLGKSLTSPSTLVPIGVGAALLAAFFIVEARKSTAFYPVRLFRSPVFLAAVLAGFIYNFGNAVAFLQTTNLWQYVTGVSTRDLAFWQIPLMLSAVIFALGTGRLMSRGLSDRTALVAGSILVACGLVILALVAGNKSFWAFLPGLVFTGGGLAVASIPFGNLIIKEAPPQQFGPVTSSRTTIGQFFYSLGFALATVAVDKMTFGGVIDKLTAAGVQPDRIGTAVTSVNQYVRTGKDPADELARKALADAATSYGNAYSTVLIAAAVLVLCAGLAAWVLLHRAHAKHE